MVLVLSESEIQSALDLGTLVDIIGDALGKQANNAVERPERPHFPVGMDLDGPEATGTGITMSAYIYGDEHYVTKLVGLHEENTERNLPTIHAQIVLTDARTGVPTAFMSGTTITNARTGCIGALAVREFNPETSALGVIGAGAQARWQTRAIGTVTSLRDVRIYSPSDSRNACATDLTEEGIPARAVDTAGDAVDGADTVVTATTATDPVFPAEALGGDALVVAVGAFTERMQELDPTVLQRASRIFADVPEAVAHTGDMLAAGIEKQRLTPFGERLAASSGRNLTGELIVVDSVGSATLDAAASAILYERAVEQGSGTDISL